MKLSKSIDLHYSPDEGIWYLQNYETDKVSISYNYRSDALKAFRSNTVEWED